MTMKRLIASRYLWLPPLLLFVGIFILWEVSVRLCGVPVYVLPPPSLIAIDCVAAFPELRDDMLVTLTEVVLGFCGGSILAFVFAVCFVLSKRVERAVYPYAIALKSIPIIAISPLLILWFGNGLMAKVIMGALICFFPVLVNTITGLKTIDPNALDLFRSLSANRIQTMLYLRLPSSLPFLFSGLK